MNKATKILIYTNLVVCLMSTYGVLVQRIDFIQDEIIYTWGNFHPLYTLFTGIISLVILFMTLKYSSVFGTVPNLSKTLRIAIILSLPFIIIATIAWFHTYDDSEVFQLGDAIWKLGYPLTFFVIDLPIYLRRKVDGLHFFNYTWMYPIVVMLFIVQFSVYIQGIRMIINVRKIKKTN